MIKRFLFLFLLIVPGCAFAQQITITGTVKDASGNPFVNGSGRAILSPLNVSFTTGLTNPVPGSQSPVNINGLDAFGHFSVLLTSTAAIDQQSSNPQWLFTFCSTSFAQFGTICFSTGPLSLSSSQDITSQISATPPPTLPIISNPASLSGNNSFTGNNSFSSLTVSGTGTFTGTNTVANENTIRWVDGVHFTTCNGAINDPGAVLAIVPPNYAGAACTNPPPAGTMIWNLAGGNYQTLAPGAFTNGTNTAFIQVFGGGYSQANTNTIQSTSYLTDTEEVGLTVPATSTIFQANAFNNFLINKSATTNAVGYFAQVLSGATGAHVWGMNPVTSDYDVVSGNNYASSVIGIEDDINIKNTGSTVAGFSIVGGSTATPSSSNGIVLAPLGSGIKWSTGFLIKDATTNNAISIGAQNATGTANSYSGAILLTTYNSGGSAAGPFLRGYPAGGLEIGPTAGQPVLLDQGLALAETTVQTAPPGSSEVMYGDSTAHAIPVNYNAGGITNFVPKTVALTADWTCGIGGTVASCTSATIIGSSGGVPMTFSLPLTSNSFTLECNGVVGQATAATANQWNLLTATNGATNVTATYDMATAATASAFGAVTDQASTTTTFQIAPSWTLSGTGTKMPFHIWAKIEGASASGSVLSLQLLAPTVADLVTIYRGTSCRIF